MTCKPSTSLPAPAADCSPTSSSDTHQSAQLNLIPTAAASCESAPPTDGSPVCECTRETFGCSIHPTTPAEWIACMQVSLASLTASLVSERAKLTSVICGPTLHESLASYDRDSRSWKTCQESFLPDTSGPSSETLPRWGMTRAGQLFPLPMLALHTGESGGGALQKWQTPVADDAAERASGKFNSRGEPKLSAQVKIYPTPCTVDAGSRFNQSDSSGAALRPTLGAMARFNLWPTPRASANENRQTKLTPSQKAGKHGMSLCAAVNLWPTPTSTLGTKGGLVTPRKSREGGTLIEAVSARAFPTPSSNDWKGSSKPGQRRGQLTDPDMGAVPAGGKLNPMWVEWLMGWPLAWTGSKPSATAKSHSRRRSRG